MTQQPLTAALAERPTHVHQMVTTRWVGRLAVLAVCGDLDMLTAPVLADAVSYAAAESPAAVIVDLTDVNFLASAGMSVLVTAHEEIAPKAGFGVVADGPATSRPMRLVGLDRTITLYRTIDEALIDIDGTVTGALHV